MKLLVEIASDVISSSELLVDTPGKEKLTVSSDAGELDKDAGDTLEFKSPKFELSTVEIESVAIDSSSFDCAVEILTIRHSDIQKYKDSDVCNHVTCFSDAAILLGFFLNLFSSFESQEISQNFFTSSSRRKKSISKYSF